MRRRGILTTAGVLAGLLLVMLAGSCRVKAPVTSAQQVEQPHSAPDFTLTDLQGQSVTLASLRGKVVMLDFWATWCPPCRKSLPHTEHISNSAAARAGKLVVLAINTNESKREIQTFMNDNRYTFRTLLGAGSDVMDRYNVQGIPTFVIIDRKGRVVWEQSWANTAALDLELARALKE